MSDQWKAEQVKQAESKVTELEKIRAAAVARMEAAQQEARRAASDIEAADSHIAKARLELEAAKAV